MRIVEVPQAGEAANGGLKINAGKIGLPRNDYTGKRGQRQEDLKNWKKASDSHPDLHRKNLQCDKVWCIIIYNFHKERR